LPVPKPGLYDWADAGEAIMAAKPAAMSSFLIWYLHVS
jgi:hypothetical protein